MITQEQVRDLIGCDLVDSSDNKIGKLGQIFLDDRTGRPEWATVNTGLFGTSESFVPLADASAAGGKLRVPYDKSKIKDAPNVDVERGHLDESEEQELYRFYGLDHAGSAPAGDKTGGRDLNRDQGIASARNDDAMTRSEERLTAGTERQTTGKARLRKWVETEEQSVTVPVTKEKARLVSEPVTDANRDKALSGPDISESDHEVTLTEERPVVDKETVPVERVRLEKDSMTEQETASGNVRKEHIEAEGVDGGKSRTKR